MHSLSEILTALGACGTFLSALYGLYRGVPVLRSHAALMRKLATTEEERDEYKGAAEALQSAADGWKASAEQLRAEMAGLREEVHNLRTQLATAVLYIRDTIEAESANSPRPPIPEDLRPLVAEAARKNVL